MPAETQFRHEEIAAAPRGWKVRTVTHPSGHQVRIAFPPGRRRAGSGRPVSILHPKRENPRACRVRNSKSFEEFIRDSQGRRWATSVSESRGGYLAEAFPVSKRGLISRRPLTAHGASEAEASDKLTERIDRQNPRGLDTKYRNLVFDDDRIIKGEYSTASGWQKFSGRSDLMKIDLAFYDGDDKTARAIWQLQDGYGSPGHTPPQGMDWSGIRDSSEKAIAKMEQVAETWAVKNHITWPWLVQANLLRAPSSDRNAKKKTFTLEQVEKKQEKAVRFLRDVVGDDDKADEIESMSLEDYATRKHITLANPSGKRANSASSAPAMFEKFHGEAPREVMELQQDVVRRKDYAGLGELVEMTLSNAQGEGAIDFEGDGVTLASNSSGTQLYLLGGSQDMARLFQTFGVDSSKDFIEFGKVDEIVYRTRKKFDQFEETDYTHLMGEGGRSKPRLIYDRLNRQLYLVGGEYKVKSEGIVH